MRKREVILMAITPDRWQYPMIACDSVHQLARWAGRTEGEIIEFLNTKKVDKLNKCRYIKVVIKWRVLTSKKSSTENEAEKIKSAKK